MLILAILSIIFAVLDLLTSFLPTISSLPFGMEDVLTQFVGTIHGLVIVMPWLSIVLSTLLMAFFIKFTLYTWDWWKWLIERIH